MQIEIAGPPETHRLTPPLVGASHECVIPLTGTPDAEWQQQFKAAVLNGLNSSTTFRSTPVLDRLPEQMTFAENNFRFPVAAEQVADNLGDMLDIVQNAFTFANERSVHVESERKRAMAIAQEQQALTDQKLAAAAGEWASRAGLA